MGSYLHKLPDGRQIDFQISGDAPTATEAARINSYLTGQPLPQAPQPATEEKPEDEQGIAGAVGSGIAAGWNYLQSGFGEMGESFAQSRGDKASGWAEWAAKQREEAGTYWSPEKGFLEEEGAYNKLRNLAFQAGVSALPLGAGIATLPFGGAGAAAIVGGLASVPQIFDENIQAQRQQNNGQVKDYGKAWAATGISAAIEAVSDRITFGVAGLGVATAKKALSPILPEAAERAAFYVTKELTKKVGAATAAGLVSGAIEESMQQAVTRWQAEMPLGDEDAMKDYLENAIVGGLLQSTMGGALAVPGTYMSAREQARANGLRDAYEDAEKEREAIAGRVPKEQSPAPEPAFLRLTDQSGKSAEQLYMDENPTSLPPEPTKKKSSISDADYNSVLDKFKDFDGVISAGRIRSEMQWGDAKAVSAMDRLIERNDINLTNAEQRYGKIKKGASGVSTPDRNYRVGPSDLETQKPYSVFSEGREFGKGFKTREEAHKFAVDNKLNEKKGGIEIKENAAGRKYSVYEDSFQDKKLPDGTTEKVRVGTKVLQAFDDPKAANDYMKSLDPNYSPETNQAMQDAQEKERLIQLRKDAAGPVQDFVDSVLGVDRAKVEFLDTIEGPQGKIAEAVNRQDADDKAKSIIQVAQQMLDPNNPAESARALAGGHELFHGIVRSGLLNRGEINQLYDLAKKAKVPGRNYTWHDKEVARQGQAPNVAPNPEEVIAEMFRGYVLNPQAFDRKNKPLMEKIRDFLKKLLRLGTNDGRDLLDAIYNRGLLANRKAGSQGPVGGGLDSYFSSVPVQGFYMKSGKVIENAKQDRASVDQWMGLLKNNGVNEDELTWLGIEQAMKDYTQYANSKSVPKEEVLNYIKANGLEVKEWVGSDETKRLQKEEDRLKWEMLGYHLFTDDSLWREYMKTPLSMEIKDGSHSDVFASWLRTNHPEARYVSTYNDIVGQLWDSYANTEPSVYNNSVQPGGENYGEMVFTLPNNKLAPLEVMPEKHFAVVGPNQLAHVRFDTRDIEGKKTLFIQEVQSDWHQAGKREGYGDFIPDAPLKSNWDEFVMKRMVRYAAENDFDYIAWHGEPDSVAHTEGYQTWVSEETDQGTKYYSGRDVEFRDNLTSIFNRYLAPNGLRSISKKLGKRFGTQPFLYDPVRNETATRVYFNNVDDIGSLSSQLTDPTILKKLQILEQLFYQNHGLDDVPDAQVLEYQRKVGLTNAEMERHAREAQGSENDPSYYKRWLWEMTKEMKTSAMGEGFSAFSYVPDSPQFQKWFYGSKVVDKDGKPIVMYHGTSKDVDFKKFKAGRRGIWFTSSTDEASMYAKDNDSKGYKRDGWDFKKVNERDRVIPVVLSIKNPYRLSDEERHRMIRTQNYAATQRDIFDVAKSRGHDGINMDNGIWVAFEPSQAKSIFNTEFSSSDPRFSTITENPVFQQWYAGSQLLDEAGNPLVLYHGTGKSFDRFGRTQELDAGFYGEGHYFTPETMDANEYLDSELLDVKDRTSGNSFGYKDGSRIIPVFVSMKRPFKWDASDSRRPFTDAAKAKEFSDQLRAEGYDGIIYGGKEDDGYFRPTEVIAFEPNQIKSIWNQEFDPTDPRFSSVWHGSAFDFDKFETKKTGTGSSANLYGWGLYFTNKRSTAEDYREEQGWKHGTKGKLYNVEIPDDPELMVWDLPFDEQPDLVQESIRKLLPWTEEVEEFFSRPVARKYTKYFDDEGDWSEAFGHSIYTDLVDIYGTPEKASTALMMAGIPGHRYLSPRSRGLRFDDPRVEFNYVVYDEDRVDTVNKFSAAAAPGLRVGNVNQPDLFSELEQKMAYAALSDRITKIVGKTPFLSERTKAKVRNFADGTIISLQDRLLPLAQMIDRLRANGGIISNETDTYLQKTLMGGRTEYRLEQSEKNLYKPFKNAMKALRISDDQIRHLSNIPVGGEFMNRYLNKREAVAELYLYAQHAHERNAAMAARNEGVNGREPQTEAGSGMTDDEAAAILRYVSTQPALFNQLADLNNRNSIRNLMRNIIADTNAARIESGLNPDWDVLFSSEAGRQVEPYQDYVPLKSFLLEHMDGDKDAIDFVRSSPGLKVMGREDKAALGRVSLASDIAAHAMLQNSEAIVRAEKNEVAKGFVQLVRDNQEDLRDVIEIVDVVPMDFALDRKAGRVRRVNNPRYGFRDGIFVAKEDGKETYVEIKDERLAKAMTTTPSLGNGIAGQVAGGLLTLNRFLSSVRTAWNPEFLVTNFLRDLQAAMLNISEVEMQGLRRGIVSDVPKALMGARENIRNGTRNSEWAKAYETFRKHGGQTFYMGLMDTDSYIQKINDHFKDETNVGQIKKGFNSLKDWIEDYNTVIENGIRLSAFVNISNRLINGSTNPDVIRRANARAAFIAKNMTVNFNAGGEMKPFANALYLFYNASIQGTTAMVMPFVRSPRVRKLWGTVVFAGLMQDLLMSMIGGEDDDGVNLYDKIPDYILENRIVFIDPIGITKNGYFSFPMPYLFNGIFGIGRNLGKTLRGEVSPIKAATDASVTLASAINPWGQFNSFLNWISPTVIDPIVDLTTNVDAFGKNIAPAESPYGIDAVNSQRYWNNTSPLYKTVASAISTATGSDGKFMPGAVEVSPNQIEYMVNWLGGGLAAFVTRSTDLVNPWGGNSALFGGKDFAVNDVPFLRTFYGNVSERNNTEFYFQNRDEVLRVRKALSDARKRGDSEEYQRLMQAYPNEYKISSKINALENQRRKLSVQLKRLRDNDKIPASKKAEMEAKIKERQNDIIGKANALLREI